MAEIEQGGDDVGGGDGDDGASERENQHTAVNMDNVVAGLERGSDDDTGDNRNERRMTAERFDVESLLGSMESPALSSAPGGAAKTPESSVAGGDGRGERRGLFDSSTPEEAAGLRDAIDTTPEEPAAVVLQKKGSRRETADASELQDLFETAGGASPSPVHPTSDGQQDRQRQQQQGAVELESSGPGAGGYSTVGAAAATPAGSDRSNATALSMHGMFESASPTTGESPAVRAVAEEEAGKVGQGGKGSSTGEAEGGGGGGMTTPKLGNRFGASTKDGAGGSGSGGKDSGRTAGNGSVLGLLDSTPSPGGGLDQSVADGSALRGRTLARLYDDNNRSSGSEKNEVMIRI